MIINFSQDLVKAETQMVNATKTVSDIKYFEILDATEQMFRKLREIGVHVGDSMTIKLTGTKLILVSARVDEFSSSFICLLTFCNAKSNFKFDLLVDEFVNDYKHGSYR